MALIQQNALLPLLCALAASLVTGCASQDYASGQTDATTDTSTHVLDDQSVFHGSPFPDVGLDGLFPVRDAQQCSVAVLDGGEASFAQRLEALKQADTSIRIQTLIFKGDESGLRIAEILKQKKAAGLDVRVIVDAFSNPWLQTQWMFFDLKQNGIEVEGYEAMALQWLNEVPVPLLTPHSDLLDMDRRYHEKMWIIDGETDHAVAVTGGLNIGNEYFRANPQDPVNTWRDQDVVVRGAIVKDLVAAFDRNFDYFVEIKKSRGIFNTNLYWDATRSVLDSTGKMPISYNTDPAIVDYLAQIEGRDPQPAYQGATCRFLQNRPRLKETYIQQAYEKLFAQAEREILVANAYFVPTPALAASIEAAAQRCVSVNLITNSPDTNNHPEISLVGRAYYRDLLAINASPEVASCAAENAGVHIWEWMGQAHDEETPSQGTMHSKYAVFDGTVSLVGSYNLDPRSEQLNSESAIVYHHADLSRQLRRLFLDNDIRYSRKVTPEAAARFETPASALDKFKQSLGSMFEGEL